MGWVRMIGPHGNQKPMLSCLTKYQGRERDCKIIPQVEDGAPRIYQHLKAPHQVLSCTPGQEQLSSQLDEQQRGEKSELGYSLQQQQLNSAGCS